MLMWRGALAAGLGCGIVYLAVAHSSATVAYTAPPVTVAVLLVTLALTGPRKHAAEATPRKSSDGPTPLAQHLGRAVHSRPGSATRVLSVRVDGLDNVSDTRGAGARDAVIDEATRRITGCLRVGDSAVPVGAGEFVVLLPRGGGRRAGLVADRIRQRLRAPIEVDGRSVVASASIGLAGDGTDLDELVHAASVAMHLATSEGGDRVRVYSRQLTQDARERLSIETELRESVAGDGLRVHFMPIVDTRSGQVCSVEALVRWQHPTLGLLAPPHFLGTAERAGLMVEIGRQVLELACAQLAEWRRRWPDLAVAVNVSEQELVHPRFAGHVFATLGRFGLPTSALHLEVTETVAIGEETITAALAPLAAAGVACSLDDFGTGHSSLHRLRRLPVRRLKIDKSFVAELTTEQGAGPMLASIISMAHGLGHTVVAEGVETADQAAFLSEHGCDELQGYLFSRAVAAEAIPSLLASITASAASGASPQAVGRR